MIASFLLVFSLTAQAAPGRVFAGMTGGSDLEGHGVVRAGLDYGLHRRLGWNAELGYFPELGLLTSGSGPRLDLVDSRWWRVGVLAQPELVFAQKGPSLGYDIGLGGARIVGLTGVRVDWLMFWGLVAQFRLDQVFPFDGTFGWTEVGAGLAVRM